MVLFNLIEYSIMVIYTKNKMALLSKYSYVNCVNQGVKQLPKANILLFSVIYLVAHLATKVITD